MRELLDTEDGIYGRHRHALSVTMVGLDHHEQMTDPYDHAVGRSSADCYCLKNDWLQ
jgi:hypothetical protein